MNDTDSAKALIKALASFETAAADFQGAVRDHTAYEGDTGSSLIAQFRLLPAVIFARGVRDGFNKWGERIPDNPTLKAWRELARADPTGGLPIFDDNDRCIYCGNHIDPAAMHDRPELDHAHDCRWLKAQETPDA